MKTIRELLIEAESFLVDCVVTGDISEDNSMSISDDDRTLRDFFADVNETLGCTQSQD